MRVDDLSISVRLRRVKKETAHVSVPISDELTKPNEDGSGSRLDVGKIIEAALALGKLESTEWESEGKPEIQLHPLQTSSEQELMH